jgi:hypothetical protein
MFDVKLTCPPASSIFSRLGGKQRSESQELIIKVVCAAFGGGYILRDGKRAEFNSAWARGTTRGSYVLRDGRALRVGIRGLYRPGCRDIGKQGQYPKVNRCHTVLLNRLHLQRIVLDHAGPGPTARKNAE